MIVKHHEDQIDNPISISTDTVISEWTPIYTTTAEITTDRMGKLQSNPINVGSSCTDLFRDKNLAATTVIAKYRSLLITAMTSMTARLLA